MPFGYTAKNFRSYKQATKYKSKLNREYGMKQSVLKVTPPKRKSYYVVVKPKGIRKLC